MGEFHYIYEWEGDSTQAYNPFIWKGADFVFPKKVRLCAGRIIFTNGDLQDYWDLVVARNELIERNRQRIAALALGLVGFDTGAGGYSTGDLPIGGDALEVVPAEPVYAGDLSLTIKIYGDGDLRVTKTIYTPQPFRFDAGDAARRWSYRLDGNVSEVQRVDLATSVEELKG